MLLRLGSSSGIWYLFFFPCGIIPMIPADQDRDRFLSKFPIKRRLGTLRSKHLYWKWIVEQIVQLDWFWPIWTMVVSIVLVCFPTRPYCTPSGEHCDSAALKAHSSPWFTLVYILVPCAIEALQMTKTFHCSTTEGIQRHWRSRRGNSESCKTLLLVRLTVGMITKYYAQSRDFCPKLCCTSSENGPVPPGNCPASYGLWAYAKTLDFHSW